MTCVSSAFDGLAAALLRAAGGLWRDAHARRLVRQLPDARSRRVVFLSHCLLNENTRYLGGACVPGCVPEIAERCIQSRLGMVQMPCPEQHAWGGVLKRTLLEAYGLRQRRPLLYLIRGPLLAVFTWLTRRAYRGLARRVSAEVADYVASGFEVVAVIGVDSSPTCGVTTTTELGAAFDRLAGMPVERITPAAVNATIATCALAGPGLFTAALRSELKQRGLNVPFLAHDLFAELRRGSPQAALTAIV